MPERDGSTPPHARMTVVAGTTALDAAIGRVMAVVGVFDGLHRGHEYLLRELLAAARERHARPMVITFDHHPDEILKGAAPPLLCDPGERLDRLAEAGVEVTVIETFDRALRETPYDAWVRRVAERVELAGFLMTPESAFGYNRGGTPETVAALGRELGYDVVVVPQFELDGRPVRSSDIRAAIAAGDLAEAARLLGRPVSVLGRAGDGAIDGERGTTTPLRFDLPVALPPPGGYPCRLEARDAEWVARLRVREDGTAAVDAPISVPIGSPLRLELASGRPEPDRDPVRDRPAS